MDKHTHPTTAFRFELSRLDITQMGMDGDGKDGKKKKRKFRGTAYSGKPLRHPYWGNVTFDLSTTEAPDPTPILVEHDRRQRAGFASLEIGSSIEITDGTLLDNEHGRAVAEESDAGFPWQMSIHIDPGSIEEVKAGATAEVNGHTVNGPAYIFRNNLIREVSFTPTGVDYNTSAAAMSAGATPAAHFQKTDSAEGNDMELEELKQQIADLKASLEKAEAEAKAAAERAEKAEQEMASMRREARLSAVKELFSALGRDFSEEAAKPYMEMTDEMFSAVAEDMKAAKPRVPDALFSAQADDGIAHDDLGKLLIDA